MPVSKTHQQEKETSFADRNSGKRDKDRRLTGKEIKTVSSELNKQTDDLKTEGYEPLFKKIHERVGLEQRY